jgi:hypothetical protein
MRQKVRYLATKVHKQRNNTSRREDRTSAAPESVDISQQAIYLGGRTVGDKHRNPKHGGYFRRTSYATFFFNTIDLFSLLRIARMRWMITAVSPSLFVFANEITEQYMDPISAVAVDKVIRWYRRIVVEGGRNEKMLRKDLTQRR